jgi:plastocyanin
MNKTIPIIVIVLLLVAGGFYFTMRSNANGGSAGGSGPVVGGKPDITFVLTGENFKFVSNGVDNPELRVHKGDLVRVEFSSTSGFHDWKVDEFGAATERVNSGGTTSAEFVADKVGTFEYYCSVGEHRAMGMHGNLIVE